MRCGPRASISWWSTGNVIEDWMLSGLRQGQCIVALPEGPPFGFQFRKFAPADGRRGPV